ncbi:MAG: bifunctional serine/threonine-protein kinase/formylglycine-generating enzyme family protein, partial [Vicinamibacterales bacterium]
MAAQSPQVNQERWERLVDLVSAALLLPPAERARYLLDACGDDQEFRREVGELVTAAEVNDAFLTPAVLGGESHDQQFPRSLGTELILTSYIGRGGAGVVYVGRQRIFGRRVAVKVLDVSLLRSPNEIDEFFKEASRVAELRHEAIVSIYFAGRSGETPFFAMEYIAGHDLKREIAIQRDIRAGKAQRANILPEWNSGGYFESVAKMCVRLARALHHAHCQPEGIIHCDVKPGNILLDPAGLAYVADFGIATSLSGVTKRAAIRGTPHYVSPEQAFAGAMVVDHRTDVYSLGVVLYELLTLRVPFAGASDQAVIRAVLSRKPLNVRRINPSVPRDMEAICLLAMSKDSAQRYPTALALAEDLERFLGHQAVQAIPRSAAGHAAWMLRRHKWSVVTGVVGVCVLVATLMSVRRSVMHDTLKARLSELDNSAPILTRIRTDPLSVDADAVQQVARARQILLEAQLNADALPLDLADAQLVSRIGASLAGLEVILHDAALGAIERSRHSESTDGGEAERLRALCVLACASHMFPENADLARLSQGEALQPRVSVRTKGGEHAIVSARRIHTLTGIPTRGIDLGATPIDQRRLAPGYYRFVIRFGEGRYHELFRELPWAGGVVSIVVDTPRGVSEVTEQMVKFEGGQCAYSDVELSKCANAGVARTLEAFYLDCCEVSNGEYRTFVEATGHEVPTLWKEAPQLFEHVGWERLPVVDVSWDDARAYAEWVGKRLVSHAEFEFALRGLEGRVVPWVDDPLGAKRFANIYGPKAGGELSHAERLQRYLTCVQAVDSCPEACTPAPTRVYNLYGNVSEFSESLWVEAVANSLVVVPSERFVFGQAWDADSWNT